MTPVSDEVGDLEDFNGGEIRGFRIGVVGTINFEVPWTYTLFAASNAFDKGFDSKDTDDISLSSTIGWTFLYSKVIP